MAQRRDQPDGVSGEVRERVADSRKVARFADVAVVVAHHEEPLPDERVAEAVRPVVELGAEPHDQQQRRVGRVPQRLVGQLDLPDAHALHGFNRVVDSARPRVHASGRSTTGGDPMINDVFVLDAVTHAYNHTRENWADEAGGHSMVEMAYALAQNPPDPRHALSKEVYLQNWSVDDLANLLFRESQTDVAVFHPLAISSFKDGYVSTAKAAEALETYPSRFIGAYICVDPLTGPKALEAMAEQKDMFGDKTLGLKLYPTSWQGHKPVSWQMDDPTLIYPLYEKAQELGLDTVAVHK